MTTYPDGRVPRPGEITVESDGTSVWVHRGGACVARFGRLAFEVISDTRDAPNRVGMGGGAQAWKEFQECLKLGYDIELPMSHVPLRLKAELGVAAEFEATYVVPLACLAALNNPFEHDVWDRGRLTEEDVAQALALGTAVSEFVPMGIRTVLPPGWDARRVAHFVTHVDRTPMEICVLGSEGTYRIEDGYHRLTAAIFRRDPGIVVSLDGFVDAFPLAFPGLIPVWNDADIDRAMQALSTKRDTTPKSTSQRLIEAIEAVKLELLGAGHYASAQAINTGYCDGFADDVLAMLGGASADAGIQDVGIDNFMVDDDGEPSGFDRDLIARHWPSMQPPEGLDWDDMDRMAGDAGFSSGTHVWMTLDGRHYDAEATQGVDNPFDLPFFKRVIASWVEELRDVPSRTP